MAKSKTKRKRTPKSVLKLPDFEQSKSAVLNSLTSPSSQRACDHETERYLGCKQRFHDAVNDRIGIEPTPPDLRWFRITG